MSESRVFPNANDVDELVHVYIKTKLDEVGIKHSLHSNKQRGQDVSLYNRN